MLIESFDVDLVVEDGLGKGRTRGRQTSLKPEGLDWRGEGEKSQAGGTARGEGALRRQESSRARAEGLSPVRKSWGSHLRVEVQFATDRESGNLVCALFGLSAIRCCFSLSW